MLFQRQTRSLTVRAPAKLNLFLDVRGKRADGYHELETLMVRINLCDTLRFRALPDDRLELRTFDLSSAGRTAEPREALPEPSQNLVIRAAELLRDATGCRQGARIDLFKRIPLAAGLAGGSSDAAATLLALDALWDLRLPRPRLQELAARLGSDVPFFLTPGVAAICRGRGEQVEPCLVPSGLHFVVVRPRTGLSTAAVFRHCHPGRSPVPVRPLVEALRHGRLACVARHLHNGLQEPAEALNADVTRLRQVFSKMPLYGHQMSGSGTSYFGLCGNRSQARQVSARLNALRTGQVFVAQSRP